MSSSALDGCLSASCFQNIFVFHDVSPDVFESPRPDSQQRLKNVTGLGVTRSNKRQPRHAQTIAFLFLISLLFFFPSVRRVLYLVCALFFACREQEVATWLSLEENANEVVFIKLDSSLNDEVKCREMCSREEQN